MRAPTAADIANDIHHAPLVITAKGQCVKLLGISDWDTDTAHIRYPNGRDGTVPVATLTLVEG